MDKAQETQKQTFKTSFCEETEQSAKPKIETSDIFIMEGKNTLYAKDDQQLPQLFRVCRLITR